MSVIFICPHCKNEEASATRVQSCDDLSYLSKLNEVKELWQCERCDNYFKVHYEITKIVALVDKNE